MRCRRCQTFLIKLTPSSIDQHSNAWSMSILLFLVYTILFHFNILLYEDILLAHRQGMQKCGVHMLAVLTFCGGYLGVKRGCDIYSSTRNVNMDMTTLVHAVRGACLHFGCVLTSTAQSGGGQTMQTACRPTSLQVTLAKSIVVRGILDVRLIYIFSAPQLF
jgi:hypothetical protein